MILQRKIKEKEKTVFTRTEMTDPTKPNPGIFNRAFKTAIGTDRVAATKRKIVKNVTRKSVVNEPQIEYESGSDEEKEKVEREVGLNAHVTNLPHGMTDTRLKTLAGDHVQVMCAF